ncbi:phage tail protein [Lysobacter arvi]|uniref:Phage tail protein n=1 Tax=Lysobacter arvi TaxID=3038776 RepID=A0ABU1CB44_9GAMM|nr:phage tail protein [Lysobacter arvi]MDR0182419.1 phage tail protein [Lysobacter arvi]
MMMSLGMFVFALPTLAYQQLQRQVAWRHASTERVGARAAHQYVGPGDETINLSGMLVPEIAGERVNLDMLRELADQGEALPLVDGTGRVYGAFAIESLSETQTLFFDDGTPRKIDFQLALKRVDDDAVTRQ